MVFKGQYFSCVEHGATVCSVVTQKFKNEKMWGILSLFMKEKGLWNYGHSNYPSLLRLYPAVGAVAAGETRSFYDHPQHASYDTRPSTIKKWKGDGEEILVTPDFDGEFAKFASGFKVWDAGCAYVVAPVEVQKAEVARWWSAQGKATNYNFAETVYNDRY